MKYSTIFVRFLTILCAFFLSLFIEKAAYSQTAPSSKIPVVVSFSILADLVNQVGGERVSVRSIVPMGGDAHVFEPSPAEVKAVAEARLVIVNGLGFESWTNRLLKNAKYAGVRVVATTGIKTLSANHGAHQHAHGVDPHAWQNVANVKQYISNITNALKKLDPEGASYYAQRATAYLAQLDALDAQIKSILAVVPKEKRKVITSHDAFHYSGNAYDIKFLAPQGVSTESEPNARAIATLITQIKAEKITAVFIENMTRRVVIDRIAQETGVAIGGTLYADSLSSEVPTYIDMMRHNATTIAAKL